MEINWGVHVFQSFDFWRGRSLFINCSTPLYCISSLQVYWNPKYHLCPWALSNCKSVQKVVILMFEVILWKYTKKIFQLNLSILKGFQLFWSVPKHPGKLWKFGEEKVRTWVKFNVNGLWAFVLFALYLFVMGFLLGHEKGGAGKILWEVFTIAIEATTIFEIIRWKKKVLAVFSKLLILSIITFFSLQENKK